MRVLFVNKLYAPDIGGGAEIVLGNLARGMQSRGHRVCVVTTTPKNHEVIEQVDAIDVVRKPLKNFYWHHSTIRRSAPMRFLWHLRDAHNEAMGRALDEAITAFDPDVIQFHNLSGWSATAWKVAFARRIPAVQVLHDYYHACPKSQLFKNDQNCVGRCRSCTFLRIGRSALSNRLSAVIGVSRAVIEAHLERGLFDRVPARHVIHNAWAKQEPIQRSSKSSLTTFGFIGTLAGWKGIRLLLDTFQRVSRQSGAAPPMRLLVAGRGEDGYEAQLRAEFASDRIEFLGRVAPESLYSRIDVCVVPSLWNDPLPSVVFESLLFGVPVIGSRRGGIPEMINDGVNGLLFDPDAQDTQDTQYSLASCLRRLAGSPDTIAALGSGALQSSFKYADLDRVVDAHIAVCAEAIKTAGALAAAR
jgi:glycosyltransferase involved in cell wall biosynthesis